MCKYCEDGEKFDNGFVEVTIVGKELNMSYDAPSTDSSFYGDRVDIEFCPMCGEKLRLEDLGLTVAQFVYEFNKERKSSKNKWIEGFHRTVEGKCVSVKSYNTYIQILDCDGVRDSGPMDCSVKTMVEWLTKTITSITQWRDYNRYR